LLGGLHNQVFGRIKLSHNDLLDKLNTVKIIEHHLDALCRFQCNLDFIR
jgi:hypothetical protein